MGDSLYMAKERVERVATTLPFLEIFSPNNDQTLQQTLSRGANDLAAANFLQTYFPLLIGFFLLTLLSFAEFSRYTQSHCKM